MCYFIRYVLNMMELYTSYIFYLDMLEMLEKGLVGCRSPMLQNTCSSTPNIHLSHTPTLSVNTSNSSIPNAGGKIVGKAVAILPKDVLEIKPMKSVGMATDYLGGGIQKFDNILTDLTGVGIIFITLLTLILSSIDFFNYSLVIHLTISC